MTKSDNAAASYGDYVTKRVGMPQGRYEGWVFRISMVTGMMVLMVPWGHILQGALPADALAQAVPSYPVGWVVAIAVRMIIGDPIVALLAAKVMPRIQGDRGRTLAMALINILIMATIMSLFGVIMGGVDDVLGVWTPNLPLIWGFALVINLFLVGPIATWITLRVARPARAALAGRSQSRSQS